MTRAAAGFDVELVWARDRLPFDRALMGRKAAGLLELPPVWVPEFIVVRAHLPRRLRKVTPKLVSRRLILSDGVQEEINRLDSRASHGFAVRSSAAVEDLRARGAFATAQAATAADLHLAIAMVLLDTEAAPEYPTGEPLPVIIQHRVRTLARGQMANTRRVSQDRRSWRVETRSDV